MGPLSISQVFGASQGVRPLTRLRFLRIVKVAQNFPAETQFPRHGNPAAPSKRRQGWREVVSPLPDALRRVLDTELVLDRAFLEDGTPVAAAAAPPLESLLWQRFES